MLDHVPLVTVDQAAATIAYASLDPRLGSWRFSTTPLCSPFFMHHLT
jgi:hypothetical protein